MSIHGHRDRRSLLAIFGANAVSLTGNVAALVAIPWFVLETTNSASKTGITAAAALLPVVLSGFFGGALVDRLGYRRTSVLSDLASAAAVAAIPLLHSTIGLEFWQLLAFVFLGGLLDAPGGTARTALLPEAATRAGWSFERATGMTAVVERGSRLAGAPLAALLIAAAGPTNVLWIDAASFLVSALLIAIGVPRPPHAPAREGTSYVQELREGYRFLRRDRTLGTLVVVVSVTNAFDAVTMVALPVLAHRVYGSATSLGLMIAVGGAGAAIGALAFASVGEGRSRRGLFTWGFIVLTVSYPVAALFPPLWILLVAKAVSGLAAGPINPVIDTVYLERVPAGARGRVFGVTHAAAWIAIPLGVLVGGSIIDLLGLRATLLVTGAAYLAVTVAARFSDALRGLDRRVPGEPVAETASAA